MLAIDSRRLPTCCAVDSAWSNSTVTVEMPDCAEIIPQPACTSNEIATSDMTR